VTISLTDPFMTFSLTDPFPAHGLGILVVGGQVPEFGFGGGDFSLVVGVMVEPVSVLTI
jgi:hypothetical protein